MPTPLPPSTDFTGSSVTEGGFKTAIASLRDFLASLLGTDGTTKAARQALGSAYNGSLSKTGAYTVVAADVGKVVKASGTWTLSLTDAATLTDGVMFALYVSSGTITVDPYLSQTVNGATTLTANAGATLVFYCDGANWLAFGVPGTAGAFTTLRVYTSTSTWSKPAGLARVEIVHIVGGGGGSGGAQASTSNYARGGDGGDGGYGSGKVIEAASLGATETVTIGAGGYAGSIQGNGGAGGTSSFGAHCSSTGGAGGAGISGSGTGASGANGTSSGNPYNWYATGVSHDLGAHGAPGAANTAGNPGVGAGGGASGGYSYSGYGCTGSAGSSGLIVIKEYYG